MTLIKSISGIRGTIGGASADNLTPGSIVRFASAYALWIKELHGAEDTTKPTVVVGRDARISGPMVEAIVHGTLMGCGIDVIDLGLCTTPGVEMAVTHYKADGGIIITASHNELEWNALKLLGARGEFVSAEDGGRILAVIENNPFHLYAGAAELGRVVCRESFDQRHIDAVLALPLVDVGAVRAKRYKVVVDGINSVGGIVIPMLLEQMGVEVVRLNCVPTGAFAHDPEPVPGNMADIAAVVVAAGADLGVAVDPDVDRLAMVCEDGTMFGEEYTLVAVADYVLSKSAPGQSTVSNLSSTRALRDITEKRGGRYYTAAVGEVNVVEKMKHVGAVIGGEGNGGVIYPALHYGRDALVGVALFLTHLAANGGTASQLRDTYPQYHMVKRKLTFDTPEEMAGRLAEFAEKHSNGAVDLTDGVKVDFPSGWVHLRKSNTEPIVRVYAEASDREMAEALAAQVGGGTGTTPVQ